MKKLSKVTWLVRAAPVTEPRLVSPQGPSARTSTSTLPRNHSSPQEKRAGFSVGGTGQLWFVQWMGTAGLCACEEQMLGARNGT